MKKSKIYIKAQIAVLKDSDISKDEKLCILSELMDREEIERYIEGKEAEL